jgi:hypothetical protein
MLTEYNYMIKMDCIAASSIVKDGFAIALRDEHLLRLH